MSYQTKNKTNNKKISKQHLVYEIKRGSCYSSYDGHALTTPTQTLCMRSEQPPPSSIGCLISASKTSMVLCLDLKRTLKHLEITIYVTVLRVFTNSYIRGKSQSDSI